MRRHRVFAHKRLGDIPVCVPAAVGAALLSKTGRAADRDCLEGGFGPFCDEFRGRGGLVFEGGDYFLDAVVAEVVVDGGAELACEVAGFGLSPCLEKGRLEVNSLIVLLRRSRRSGSVA